MSKLPHIYTRRLVLNELETNILVASTVPDPLIDSMMGQWRAKQAEEALRDCIFETSDDAYCLVLMSKRHGSHFLLTKLVNYFPFRSMHKTNHSYRILSTVKEHAASTSFVLDFLNHLALSNSLLSIPRAAVRLCFEVLLLEIAPSLLLLSADQKSIVRHRRLGSAIKLERSSSQNAGPEQIAEVICNCLDFCVVAGLDSIVRQILTEESFMKPSNCANTFETVYMPFLQHLLGLMKQLQTWKNKQRRHLKEVPVFQQNTSVKMLFCKLTKRHLHRLHLPNPPLPDKPMNWTKPKKGCNEETCRDCKKLDRFLEDPLEKYEQFKVSAIRRKHIQQQIRGIAGASDSQGTTVENVPTTEFRFRVLQDPYPGILILQKTHKNWESQMLAWSKKCDLAMNEVEQELVGRGGAELLSDISGLMSDMRELVHVKLKVAELCTDLC